MNKTQINKFRETYSTYHGPIGSDGLELATTFDEKDDVKRLGAKWNPAPNGARGGYWSMPANRVNMDCPIEDPEFWGDGGSGTIFDWLNNHKMVVGPAGHINADDCQHYIGNDSTEHVLRRPGTEDTLKFQIWEHFIGVTVGGVETPIYMSLKKGREMWDASCADGMRPVLVAAQPTS